MATRRSILSELRIAVANFRPGGMDTGSTSRWDQAMRWDKTVSALRAWQPHLVLCQEISATASGGLRAHLWTTANTLDTIPLLGPPSPGPVTGDHHPAILVAASAGLVILDAGPTVGLPGMDAQPAWCEALVQVPGWTHPLRAYSVDLGSRSSVEQRSQADRLASRIAGTGELAVAGGNWDSYGRADAITPAALDFAPLHLRPSRMRYTPQDRTLTPNYDVHDVLASVGLEDVFAVLTPGQREPDDLMPGGTRSGGRVDRFYLTRDLTDAAARFARQDIGDSEHQALILTLDGPSAARAIPPGPP
jgi:hypothetical protein